MADDYILPGPASHIGRGHPSKKVEDYSRTTILHEAGIPAAVVEEWVGHDSAEVLKA